MLKSVRFKQWMVLGMAALLVILSTGVEEATSKTIKLRAVSAWPKTVYEVQNFMKFLDMVRENVEKQYPGELEIQYTGGPEVIPNREQVEALRNGLVDMVFTTDGYYTSALPEVNALSLTKLKPWEERATGVNAFLNKGHESKLNAFYLGRMGSGIPFTLYLNKPITGADLSGLKIRCSPTHINFLKKLGAQPLVIPPPDVYTALERGLADGFIWPAGLIRDWGWHEVTKYIVTTNFYMAVNVVLVNKNKWDKMPEHLQQLLIQTQEQAEHYTIDRGKAHVEGEFAAFKKQGIQFIDLPAADAKKFEDTAYSELWDIVIEKAPENGPILKNMVSK
jgi:TRAP-type C4-dicarboxylate transport system substrate-binding protein